MRQLRLIISVLVCLTFGLLSRATAANPVDWNVGDVFAGVGGGSYQVWHSTNPTAAKPTYTQITTISDGSTSPNNTNGCGFDLAFRFFGTNSGQNLVDRYAIDNEHPLPEQLIPGAAATSTQSIAFDGGANLYIGFSSAQNGMGTIERWTKDTNPDANFGQYVQTAIYSVPVDGAQGPGWIDLAADGVTLYYTSQGPTIRTFNTSTMVKGIYATLTSGTTLFALRILPPGDGTQGVLVAAQGNVLLVNPTGVVSKFQFGNDKNLQSLSLDSSVPTRAWVGDATRNDFILFDFVSKGTVASFNTGKGTALGGLCVDGSFSGAEMAAAQTQTPVVAQTLSPSTKQAPTANTVTFTSPFTGATFTDTFADLSSNISVTVRDSLVDPSLALSDPTVFSFNFGGPGGTVPGNLICDTALTTAANFPNKCELFEVEANPNSGFTTTNVQIEPPANVTDLPNLRFLRNLDEDITDDLDIGGTRTTKCVYTVNQQVIAGGFGTPTFQICSFTPADGTVLSKSAGSANIDFKLNVNLTGQCSGGGNSGVPQNLPLLLTIVQLQTNGTAPVPIQVLVSGNSGGFPIFAFSGNTYQLQVKTTDLPAGFTYVATVLDLSGAIPAIASHFTLTK